MHYKMGFSLSAAPMSEVSSRITTSHIVLVGTVIAVVTTAARYRRAIRRRLQQLRDQSYLFGGLSMERTPPVVAKDEDSTLGISKTKARFKIFELNPEFCKTHKGTWRLQSLGDYLDTLRPAMLPSFIKKKDVPEFVNTELEAALSTALLRVLGPVVGRAALPALGWGPIPAVVERVSTELVGRFLADQAHRTVEQQAADNDDDKKDAALLPISIMSVWAVSETTVVKHVLGASLTPLEKMRNGEHVTTGPTFADATFPNSTQHLIPKRFVLFTDWDRALEGMEQLLMEDCPSETSGLSQLQGEQEASLRRDLDENLDYKPAPYNPDGRDLGVPVPVNPRLFPDLHMGWGDVQCTHTHRQVLRNRLLSTILNRLAANYYYVDYRKEEESLFRVVLDQKDGSQVEVDRPELLLIALSDMGHSVRMNITTHPTTFGMALCIKENDGWTNVPMATFLGSGYEDHAGRIAPALMPHSGLNLEIGASGPLFSNGKGPISIQHFMGFEGFAGWQSNHNADVPWIRDTTGPEIEDISSTARLAALYATILNSVGTDLELPLGGYGLVGVCNDSAAVLECAIHGTTSIYPLTAVGKYSMHAIRYAKRYKEVFAKCGVRRKAETDGLTKLIGAIRMLPSDIHALPSTLPDATRRMLHCLPIDLPFQLMVEASRLIHKIRDEEDER